ncbi:hypothetical protein MCBMB27_05697 (plasmid) [Methylobacterium phyllosphaerae]|uniref:PD-(D/E)XK nuclease superfamily protein n=1 Tax=Methylobacterium phyllosphaerae TaxID=418223 RepID=A0AAE8L9I2_9HYPH|nr:PD-(D/E)XK nuclease family protein [Methylobacterium phyllosphaerae]APT34988.1 hypothetical protein MCBMB27_05697 [Methylobacterium phyllosphaerae]SFH65527.1 PD-(D/E)XK nuclease superfamily protein [Methylobacterium phyllosphaerae]
MTELPNGPDGLPIHIDALERLIVGDPAFVDLEKALGRFCLFEALNVVRGEVPLGNLLAAFLDPRQAHGFGARLLRTFLMEAVRAGRAAGIGTEGLAPLSVHLLDLDEAEVRREWHRIDILVRVRHAKLVVAVELKIGSRQGPSQLEGYRRTVEKEFGGPGWRRLYVFLTVDPEDPLDKVWIPLRYQALVPALEQVKVPAGDAAASAALAGFLGMLRRHHVTDDALEEIARKLWASHRAALTFLADRRPDGMRGVFASLRDQVDEMAGRFAGLGFTFVADQCSTTSLRFACAEWDGLPGMMEAVKWTASNRLLLFELKRYGDRAVAELYLGPGTQQARGLFLAALAPYRHRQDLQPGNEWMCVAKKVILTPQPSEDLDLGGTRESIIERFGTFCRETAVKLDPALRSSVVSGGKAAFPDPAGVS